MGMDKQNHRDKKINQLYEPSKLPVSLSNDYKTYENSVGEPDNKLKKDTRN